MGRTLEEMVSYAKEMASGAVPVNEMRRLMAERFLRDLGNPGYRVNEASVDFCVDLIENTFRHMKGPAAGELFKLERWQKFILLNLVGFELRDRPGIRRFTEAFIFIPRKNSKTFFASALAWALSLLDAKSYSTLYIVATKLDRAREAFDNILYNVRGIGADRELRILDNNAEHSITGRVGGGSIRIQALAQDAKRADGLNANFFILDEIHGYKSANEYHVYQQAMKAYENKLLLGITTAGGDANSFCAERLRYCREIVRGAVRDERYFVFIAEADDPTDYMSPHQHEIANPNYGVTISPSDMADEALRASHSASGRTEFLNKSLNVYVNSLDAYFQTSEFEESDSKYDWSLGELAKLGVTWYGGADLAKMHDLTAVALYGSHEGVDIAITHAFIPKTEAMRKANESNIPVFGWEEDGWLTMTNTPTTHYDEVAAWFEGMRKMGFRIKHVGYDPKFGRDFVAELKKRKFKVTPTSQWHVVKSQGFRQIERQVKEGRFYYLHSGAFLHCVGNVKAVEDADDMVKYSKIDYGRKIDVFDAAVMACYECLESSLRTQRMREWLGDGK